MTIKLNFLSASVPLTKTISKNTKGEITKSAYPLVGNFTSEEVQITTLRDFYQVLVERALSKSKPCLIKGHLSRPLSHESRKGTTTTNAKTQWVCLDLDEAPFTSHEEFMRAVNLNDVSYIWQASSSFGLKKTKTLSGHIFLILSRTLPAPQLKAWLMGLNFKTPALEQFITLSKSCAALHYPLDVTTCQNDKLLYIAEPIFQNLVSPIKSTERIQYIRKAKDELEVSRMELIHMDSLRTSAANKRNDLRVKTGMKAIHTKVKMEGEYEVQRGVGSVANYEVIDCGEYYRYNLNGGDSQAYWHPKSDTTYLHSFKGEPSVLLKELLPDWYAELVARTSDAIATPSTNGDLILAFREKRTAEYWKGIWNPSKTQLDIHKVKNETMLEHFRMSHGLSPQPYVPEWELIFDPQQSFVIDEEGHRVNAFVPTPLMQLSNTTKGSFPIIQRVIDSAVGKGPIQEHFLNWLACIVQHRQKTKTAWILQGCEGTGKGIILNDIMRPIFKEYAGQIKAAQLQHDFDAWQERKLFMMIDEIEVDIFEKKSMEGSLRNLVTEPITTVHRKGVDAYERPSFINVIFASNKPQPIRIPPTDRRYNVGVFQTERFQTTRKEIEQDLPKELTHFAHYLLTRKADLNVAGQILHTADRELIQTLGLTSADEIAQALTTGNLSKLFESMPDIDFMDKAGIINPAADAYVLIMRGCLNDAISTRNKISNLSREQIMAIFEYTVGIHQPSPNKFTSFARHHGINIKPIRIGNTTVRGLQVGWRDTSQQLNELRPYLEQKRKPIRRIK